MTSGITMNGPIPTIAFMFSATHSVRPRPRSSFSDGRGVDMGGAKRPKHIRCMGGAKACFEFGGCRTLHGFCEGCGFFSHARPSVREERADWNRPVGKKKGGIRKPASLNTARVRDPIFKISLKPAQEFDVRNSVIGARNDAESWRSKRGTCCS